MYNQGVYLSILLSISSLSTSHASSDIMVCPITMTPLAGILTASKDCEISKVLQKYKINDAKREQFENITIMDLARIKNTSVEKEMTNSSVKELVNDAAKVISSFVGNEAFVSSLFYRDWTFLVSFADFEFLSSKNASEIVARNIGDMQDLCLDILSLHFGVLPSRILQRSGLSKLQARMADKSTWNKVMHALITESLQWRAYVRSMPQEEFINSYMSGYDKDPSLNTFTVNDMKSLHEELQLSVTVEQVEDCNKNKLCKAERVLLGLAFLLMIVLCVIIRIGYLKIRRRKQKSMSY